MTLDPKDLPSLFTHVDVTSGDSPSVEEKEGASGETEALLRRLISVQERQTALLEELLKQQTQTQRQRGAELAAWRQAHPDLADKCRKAAEALSKVHADFLDTLANEVDESSEDMIDSDYMLSEFVDRFGPRIAHLNGVLQILAQLGTPNAPAK
jgi:ATP-dependent exoDNAse (exonuclease V) beta subunit